MGKKQPLCLITGSSFSGKKTIINELVRSKLAHVLVCTTTRQIEEEEKDYFITISESEFNEKKINNCFFETISYKNHDNVIQYGYERVEFEKLNERPCFAIVSPRGFEELKKYANFFFLIEGNSDKKIEKIIEKNKDVKKILEIEKLYIDYFETLKKQGIEVLNNNYDKESLENILKIIVNELFIVGNPKYQSFIIPIE